MGFSVDSFRYLLGLGVVTIVPVVLAFWFTIHGASAVWRRFSPALAYSVALCAMLTEIGRAHV